MNAQSFPGAFWSAFSGDPHVALLGCTLAHFLWQGALWSVVLAVALRCSRHAAPRFRYGAATLALLGLTLSPVLTYAVLSLTLSRPAAPASIAASSTSSATLRTNTLAGSAAASAAAFAPMSTWGASVAAPDSASSPSVWNVPWNIRWDIRLTRVQARIGSAARVAAPWAIVFWLSGLLLMALRLMGGGLLLRRLRSRNTDTLDEIWQARVAALSARFAVAKTPRAAGCATLDVPVVIGAFRALILLPTDVLNDLPRAQAEALVAHELAHVARRDLLLNLLQSCVECALFFHPGVWWVSAQMRREREFCCDDLVTQTLADKHTYARALTALEQRRRTSPGLTLAANASDLPWRVRRILGVTRHMPGPSAPHLAAWIGLALLAAAPAWAWQSALPAPAPAALSAKEAQARKLGYVSAAQQENFAQLKREGDYSDREVALLQDILIRGKGIARTLAVERLKGVRSLEQKRRALLLLKPCMSDADLIPVVNDVLYAYAQGNSRPLVEALTHDANPNIAALAKNVLAQVERDTREQAAFAERRRLRQKNKTGGEGAH